MFGELVNIAVVTWGGKEYAEELKRSYSNYTKTPEQIKKVNNPRLFDSADPEQANNAASILSDALKQKKRLEGLH